MLRFLKWEFFALQEMILQTFTTALLALETLVAACFSAEKKRTDKKLSEFARRGLIEEVAPDRQASYLLTLPRRDNLLFHARYGCEGGITLEDYVRICTVDAPSQLYNVLFRFEKQSIVACRRSKKFHLDVKLTAEQQRFFQFLWKKPDGSVVAYRLKRVCLYGECKGGLPQIIVENHPYSRRYYEHLDPSTGEIVWNVGLCYM